MTEVMKTIRAVHQRWPHAIRITRHCVAGRQEALLAAAANQKLSFKSLLLQINGNKGNMYTHLPLY